MICQHEFKGPKDHPIVFFSVVKKFNNLKQKNNNQFKAI